MAPVSRIALVFACFTTLQVSAFDMAAMEKWSNAKVVKYLVKGEHNARTSVVHGDYEGKADVIDRITLEFTWDVRKREVVGQATVKDDKTVLKNLKSDGTNCPPPTLKGEYEHFVSVSNAILGDQLEVKGVRTYPAAMVSNYPGGCSMRPIPGAKEDVRVHVPFVDPEILALPPEMTKGGPVSVASDGKSFSVKGADNWVWTFMPTIVQ